MHKLNPSAIEDYALIGDCRTAALVSRTGSIDWLCWPRFDSAACFAALVGTPEHGRWLIAPKGEARISRTYRDGSLVLETVFETAEGAVALIDFMPIGLANSSVVRIVEGRRGQVTMRTEILLRFDYGSSVPWVTRMAEHQGIVAIVGPDMAALRTPVRMRGHHMLSEGEFTVAQGERVPFVLAHGASHLPPPAALDADRALADTEAYWTKWSGRCRTDGPYRDAVKRSLVTLKGLTYAPTGGIVAAATTSLPEQLGGARNWDYRFCWLRDATLTLFGLMDAGYYDEAKAWRDWLHRSVAGSPDQVQIMYGIGGERRLSEWEVPWLPGYQGAAPVRIGNAASEQVQLDVYGEVVEVLHHARDGGIANPGSAWSLQKGLLEHLEKIWEQPDEGMWEVRGGPKNFTLSKAMAWLALDRSILDARKYRLSAPLDKWEALRDRIHETVCRQGFNSEKNSFTQHFDTTELDASLLLLPAIGFLPAEDARIRGTVAAIERELLHDGFVLRYRTESGTDGLQGREGAFLACSFWLADNYTQQGRHGEARALFERLLSLRNDVGLFSEEYDPVAKRQVGNVPQAFSHVAMLYTAKALQDEGAAERRAN